jgi:uncharacterized membrane protein
MMNFIKREWSLLVLVLGTFLAAFLIYPKMPDMVPIHWNIQGEVDGYGSRFMGTFLMPLVNLGMYVLLLVTPKLDPKRANYEKFEGSYRIIRFTLHIFFALIFALTVYVSLGHPIDVGLWIPAGVCVLIIILGNLMGRVRHNYFVGFKFPWTLASEEVWQRTHRFGSKLMVLGGIFALVSVFLTEGNFRFILMMIGIMLPTIIITIYSYVIYRKING